jgi:hypothetical protein
MLRICTSPTGDVLTLNPFRFHGDPRHLPDGRGVPAVEGLAFTVEKTRGDVK